MTPQPGRIAARKNETAASTLPEIGKIKIGEKVKNATGTEYPKALDYFRATGNFAAQFSQVYGAKPTKLSVVFISDSLAEVCNQRYEAWIKGKKWGEGDGTSFTVYDEQTKTNIRDLPATDERVKKLQPYWQEMVTLRFVLLEMKGIMGYWSFTSKGKTVTIPSIIKSFDFVRERAGTIIGFPFSLVVEMKTGYNPGEARKYPKVDLVPNFSQESIDMVSEYLAAGGEINKITTAMIQQKQVLIEGGKLNNIPEVKDVMQQPLIPEQEGGAKL